MILYHGSHAQGLTTIKPLSALSNEIIKRSISTDTGRRCCRDVVFLTNNPDLARQYAGKAGVIYIVKGVDVQPYAEYAVKAIKKGSKKLMAKKMAKIAGNTSVFVAKKAIVYGILA